MPDQGVLEEMVRRISELETRLKKMELEKQKFEILNIARVVLNTDQTAWNIPDVDKISIEASVAAVTINGIANGVDGRILYLENTKSGTTITINHNSGLAAVGNKIFSPTGAAVVLAAAKSAYMIYSFQVGVAAYGWRIMQFS